MENISTSQPISSDIQHRANLVLVTQLPNTRDADMPFSRVPRRAVLLNTEPSSKTCIQTSYSSPAY